MRSLQVCAIGAAIAAMGLVTLVVPKAALAHDVAANCTNSAAIMIERFSRKKYEGPYHRRWHLRRVHT